MQEIHIDTGTSWYGSEVLRDFLKFLITEGFSINAEYKSGSGIVLKASRWVEVEKSPN